METAEQQQAILSISGMACSGCAHTVQESLTELDGVKEVTVSLDDESATVTFDPGIVSTEAFEQAVEKAGYNYQGIKE